MLNTKVSGIAEDGLCRHNYLLDLLKVFFALEIALSHFHQGGAHLFATTNSFVSFFFIISGFYLARGFFSGKYHSAGAYTLHRIGRLMPAYLVAFIAIFIFRSIISYPPGSFDEFGLRLVNSLPELFLVQNLGVFDGGINYPLWYVCVLVFVSHIVFALLVQNRGLALNVVGPLVIVLTGTYLFNVYHTHDVSTFSVAAMFFYEPLLRGFCFIFLGVCLYRPALLILDYVDRLKHAGLLSALVCVASIVCLWRYDATPVYLVFLALIVFSSSAKMPLNRLLAKGGRCVAGISGYMGELSLSIYFNHALVIYAFKACYGLWDGMPHIGLLILFLVVLLAYSAFAIFVTHVVRAKLVPRLKAPFERDR